MIGLAFIGVGLGAGLAVLGIGVGIGRIGGSATEAISRQPEAVGRTGPRPRLPRPSF